jgi:hypothetical protein
LAPSCEAPKGCPAVGCLRRLIDNLTAARVRGTRKQAKPMPVRAAQSWN